MTGKTVLEETSQMGTTEGLDLTASSASGNTHPLCRCCPPLWKGESNADLSELLQD